MNQQNQDFYPTNDLSLQLVTLKQQDYHEYNPVSKAQIQKTAEFCYASSLVPQARGVFGLIERSVVFVRYNGNSFT